ncbi:DUF2817 domain-containing protein [Nannocystaceae bacterium ST9]
MVRFAEAERVLPELGDLHEVLDLFGAQADTHVLARVSHGGIEFPIHGVVVGARRADAPTLALIGGVHGLERIGTRVVLAGMHTFAQYLAWDRMLAAALDEIRLVFVPLVNPVGMWMLRRSNPRGVDLMRNAPPHPDASGTPLVGGHRYSSRLPWYQGPSEAPMELEAAALCDFMRAWVLPSRAAITLDVHSGFGSIDRLWFPYAYTRRPFPSLAEAYALKCLLDDTMPHHIYEYEPVSRNYRVQGDLWDFLYDERRKAEIEGPFLPLTLELGSWAWVRKNPAQLLDVLGSFNPIRPHRLRRTLRRHLPLIEFLLRAVAGSRAWSAFEPHERQRLESEGFRLWFAR